jgi:beta-glucosidase
MTLAPGESTRLFFDLPLSAFAFWDVAVGRWRVEPGAYELLAGASSADVRQRTVLTRGGEPGVPRPVLERGLDAADFDEQSGTEIVDRTKESGDAVTPLGGKDGELLYRGCDLGTGVREVSVEVSGGTGTVEVAVDGGPLLAAVSQEKPTAGPYAYVTRSAPVVGAPRGVRDVRLRVRGALRVARVGFSG